MISLSLFSNVSQGVLHYTLEFEDDADALKTVPAHLVVEWPDH